MKGKAIIPLVLGLAVGLVAVRFLVDAVKKAQGATGDKATVSILRAKQDIEPYSMITEEMIEEVQTTDVSLVPATERISTKKELLEEKRVVAKSVAQHTPILRSMLAPPGTEPGLKGRIPKGFRAVSVKIDEVTGVAYQLSPGDYVDVIAVMDVQTASSRTRKQTVAEVILQNVQVLAIGQDTSGVAAGAESKVKPAKSATLAVPEDEAPKLHLAQSKGKITLSMRGEDSKLTQGGVVGEEVFEYARLAGLVGTQETPMPAPTVAPVVEPAPKAAPPHGVTVFYGSQQGRDSKIQRVTFENPESRTIIGVVDGPVDRSIGTGSSRYPSYGGTPPAGPRTVTPNRDTDAPISPLEEETDFTSEEAE